MNGMPVQKELIARIRQLEEMNSALQDKLDMIYAILAPDYDEGTDEDVEGADEAGETNLVQIDIAGGQRKPS